MSLINIFDAAAVLAVLAALLFVARGWKRALDRNVKLILIVLLVTTAVHNLVIFLEWMNISRILDMHEDFMGILEPLLWGFLVFTFFMSTEVSRRQHSEEELYRIKKAVDSSGDAIGMSTAEGHHFYQNRAFTELFGYTVEEFRENDPPSLIYADSAVGREVFATIMAGEPWPGEVEMKSKDGRRFPVLLRADAIKNTAGEIIGLVGVHTDITDLKKAEKERLAFEAGIREAQKLESLGILAGGIAHDFNNILTAILGNADLALMEMTAEMPARNHVADIKNAAKRAADLTNQMLAYSGKGQFVIENVDLSSMVDEMGHMLEVCISGTVAMEYDLAEDLPPVRADPTQLRQVVMNLITNASEAVGKSRGVVSISTATVDADRDYLKRTIPNEKIPEGRYVTIEVRDTGCGMDAETRDKVFDPFYSTKFTGRGLGMAAVMGIVRGHKGAIGIDSEKGAGTTVMVLLPAAEATPPAEEADAEPADHTRDAGTVLLVDDEEPVRTVGRKLLERLGMSVLTAADGREAVELYARRNKEIDLVILDLTMPRMDGEAACRELRRIDEDIRVIVSSGYNQQEVSRQFAATALSGFIQKPYTMRKLESAINEVLR